MVKSKISGSAHSLGPSEGPDALSDRHNTITDDMTGISGVVPSAEDRHACGNSLLRVVTLCNLVIGDTINASVMICNMSAGDEAEGHDSMANHCPDIDHGCPCTMRDNVHALHPGDKGKLCNGDTSTDGSRLLGNPTGNHGGCGGGVHRCSCLNSMINRETGDRGVISGVCHPLDSDEGRVVGALAPVN